MRFLRLIRNILSDIETFTKIKTLCNIKIEEAKK